MTVNRSIDPARMLGEHLAQASPDMLRELLGTFINTLLSAQADAVCGTQSHLPIDPVHASRFGVMPTSHARGRWV